MEKYSLNPNQKNEEMVLESVSLFGPALYNKDSRTFAIARNLVCRHTLGVPDFQHETIVASFDKWLKQRNESPYLEPTPEFKTPSGLWLPTKADAIELTEANFDDTAKDLVHRLNAILFDGQAKVDAVVSLGDRDYLEEATSLVRNIDTWDASGASRTDAHFTRGYMEACVTPTLTENGAQLTLVLDRLYLRTYPLLASAVLHELTLAWGFSTVKPLALVRTSSHDEEADEGEEMFHEFPEEDVDASRKGNLDTTPEYFTVKDNADYMKMARVDAFLKTQDTLLDYSYEEPAHIAAQLSLTQLDYFRSVVMPKYFSQQQHAEFLTMKKSGDTALDLARLGLGASAVNDVMKELAAVPKEEPTEKPKVKPFTKESILGETDDEPFDEMSPQKL
jgi:hypothetical protein